MSDIEANRDVEGREERISILQYIVNSQLMDSEFGIQRHSFDVGSAKVTVCYREAINFALVHNGVGPLAGIGIINPETEESLTIRGMSASLASLDVDEESTSSTTEYQWEYPECEVAPDSFLTLDQTDLVWSLPAESFINIDESRSDELKLTVVVGDERATTTLPIRLLAHDEWNAATVPELLAAFVRPRAEAVQGVLSEAADLLQQSTGDPSLVGYQRGEERVRKTAEAIYTALQRAEIRYSEPPASFEATGQRIRTHDEVIHRKFGTCIDLSLLYAACLEEAGLNPIVAIMPGHAVAGLFLHDTATKRFVISTPDQMSNLFGGDLMVAVETVGVTSGVELDFESAVRRAHVKAASGREVRYVLDIRAAHRRVRPLPKVSVVDGTRVIETTKMAVPRRIPGNVDRTEPDNRPTIDRAPARVQRWLSDLLDLTRRNPLLNLSSSRGVEVLVSSAQLGDMEDLIQSHGVVKLRTSDDLSPLQRSRGWSSVRQIPEDERFDVFSHENALFVHNERGNATNKLVRMRREAQAAAEETGSNSLFLTLGSFRWVDSRGGPGGRAPLYLLPVHLSGSQSQPFEVVLDSSQDLVPNFCLIEKLKQEHQLEFDVLENPYQDASGIDIERILVTLRDEFIRRGLDFSVDEQVFLANLQFSTIDLWRDVKDHWDQLAERPLVGHMINGNGEIFVDAVEAPSVEAEDEAESRLPLPADSSQLAAIRAATAGCSFVLEGPPGTGKSQTITNMIADGIASGRSILFVAEKQAALEVVEDRLNKVGLGSLILNVHGAKQSPAPVRKQLAESLDDRRSPNPAAFETLIARLRSQISELSEYPQALHGEIDGRDSVWSLYQHWAQLNATDSDNGVWSLGQVEVSPSIVEAHGDELVNLATRIHRLSRMTDGAHDQVVWQALAGSLGSHRDDLTREAVENLVEAVRRWFAAFDKLDHHVLAAVTLMSEKMPLFLEWLADLPSEKAAIPSQLHRPEPDPEAVRQLRAEAQQLRHRWGSIVGKLTSAWRHMNLAQVRQKYRDAQDAGFFKRQRLVGNATEEILTLVHPQFAGEYRAEPLRLLNDIESLHAEMRSFAERSMYVVGRQDLDPLDTSSDEYLARIVAEIEENLRQRDRIRTLTAGSPVADDVLEHLVTADLSATRRGDQLRQVEEFQDAWEAVLSAARSDHQSIGAWTKDRTPIELIQSDRENSSQSCASVGQEDLADMVEYEAILARLRSLGLEEVALKISNGSHTGDLDKAMELACAQARLDEALKHSGLASVDRHEYHESVERYVSTSRMVKKNMVSELPAQILESARRQKSINSSLRKEVDRSRGGSIRKMFQRFGDQIQEVTPCILMSPASVARYLESAAMRFDTVIFDEASQIRVADAVGALGRADSVVVVGDSRQMPPTSTFALAGGEEQPDDTMVGDQESILSEAVATGMNQRWLSWHYRSRDDSLIAFSNRKYYRNRLSVFPSPPEKRPGMGVESVFIGGQFRHGAERDNLEECEAIVQELRRRFAKDPQASIGVITFNIQQRDLILDELENCSDEAVRQALVKPVDPLFVKNLENVQGDERDHILFSLAFSPRADDGRLPMNFGPLNNAGGERRLNVAITRARESVILYASMKSADLDLRRTRALGIAHLKEFLAFAESRSDVAATPHQERYDLYRDSVRDALTGRGLEVVTDVGVSSFRVDLAVRASSTHGWLAVLFDTPEWSRRIAVADRVALPTQILEGVMGWRGTYQMLLPVWHENHSETVEEIVGLAQSLVLSPEVPPSHGADDESDSWESVAETPQDREGMPPRLDAEETLVLRNAEGSESERQETIGSGDSTDSSSDYREFTKASLGSREELDRLGDRSVATKVTGQLSEIIRVEGPIEAGRLAKTLGRGYGLSRVTSARTAEILRLVQESPDTIEHLGTFYWPPSIDPQSYEDYRPRVTQGNYEAREISPREIANSMEAVLQTFAESGEEPPTRDQLMRASAALFNFNRVAVRIREWFGLVLDWMVDSDRVRESDGGRIILSGRGTGS